MNALLAFFLGQLSLAVLLFAFIKFFIFGEVPTTIANDRRRSRPLLHSRLRRRDSAVLKATPLLSTETILKKTFYNVAGHQPESLDWFNVLVAQTLARLRAEAQHDNAIIKILTEVLNGSQKPDFLDDIVINEVNLGEEFPILSNCRIIRVEEAAVARTGSAEGQKTAGVETTRLQARLDVDVNDVVTLGIETNLVLNYPKPVSAVLPVALAVSVVRFRGTLSLSFVPAPAQVTPETVNRPSPTTLEFSFLPDYDLELSVRSLVGSRSRLQDLPKIAQLVEARIHAWFDERCVEARVQQIVIPNIWPRKKNTRGGDEDDDTDTHTASQAHSRTVSDDNSRANTVTSNLGYDGTLEARLAEEGRKLRASECAEPHHQTGRQAILTEENVRRRRLPQHSQQHDTTTLGASRDSKRFP